MILLQDWYAASTNRLCRDDATGFMGICSEINSGSAETKNLALQEIANRNRWDSNLRYALLPRLIRIGAENEVARAIVIRDLLANNPNLGKLLDLIASRRWKDVVDGVRNLCNTGSSGTVEREDYARLDESIHALCILSYLSVLPASEAGELYDDEDFSTFFEQAANGGNGRLCLTLALRVGVELGLMEPYAALRKLQKAVPPYFQEPDLAELALEITFRDTSSDAILDMLEKDGLQKVMASCGVDLGQIDNAHEEYWTNSVNNPESHLGQICTMWTYAVEMVALRAAQREGKADSLSRRLCNVWRQLLEVTTMLRGLPIPWMYRGSVVYDKSKGKASFEYPLMVRQAEVAKAAFAIPIIEGMTRALQGDIPPFFSDVLINLSDAFGTAFVRTDCEDVAEQYYSRPMMALLSYGKEVLSCIGKGYLNVAIPASYVQRVRAVSLPVLEGRGANEPEQVKVLHSGASIMVCARFAYEELSGAYPEGRYWHKGEGENTLAAFVCRAALNQWRAFIESSAEYESLGISPVDIISTPISLAFERYPELINARTWDCGNVIHELSNASQIEYEARKSKLNVSKVSFQRWLMRRFTIDEWAELDYDESPECWIEKLPLFSGANYQKALFALTCKLRSALEVDSPFLNPDISNHLDEALSLWASRVAQISNAQQCPRVLRFELVETLVDLLRFDVVISFYAHRNEMGCSASLDVRDIAQLIIETVAETSGNTPFYTYRLSKRLLDVARDVDNSETIQYLLSVYFHCVYMQGESEQQGLVRIRHPYVVLEQEENKARKNTLMRRFLAKVGAQQFHSVSFRQAVEERLMYTGVASGTLVIQPDRISIASREFKDEAAIRLWDPDTLAFNDNTIVNRVFYQTHQGRIQPIERGFVELLAEKVSAKRENAIRLILVDYGRMIFSERPGYNYVLPRQCWDKVSYSELTEAAERNTSVSPLGISLSIEVVISSEGEPVLKLCEEPSFDNVAYRHLFSEGDVVDVFENNGLLSCRHDFSSSACISELRIGVKTTRPSAGWQVVKKGGWNIVAQRTKMLGVEPPRTYSVNTDQKRVAECIKRYTNLRRDVVVILRGGQRFSCADRQNERAWTRENVPIRLAAESIVPIPNGVARLQEDTPAVVATAACVRGANGIIWSYALEKETIPVEIRYLDEAGRVRIITRTMEELGASARDLWAGLPVRVDVATERVEFASQPKPLVRRLWNLGDGGQIGRCFQKALRAINPMDGGDAIIRVDANGGRLVLLKVPDGNFPVLEARDGSVSRIVTYRSNDGLRDVVRYTEYDSKGGVHTLYGESEAGQFTTIDRCSSLVARLDAVDYGGRTLYDIHLVFEPIPDKNADIEQRLQRGRLNVRGVQFAEDYEEWLSLPEWAPNGKRHVEGILDLTSATPYLHPTNPIGWLPRNPSRESSADRASWQWANRIPVTAESADLTIDSGPTFAFARIVELEDGRTAADLVGTTPFSARRFKKWLTRNPRWNSGVNSYTLALTVVDYREKNFLFTWAPGFTLRIPGKRVSIDGRTALINQLFYGDKFSRFSLTARNNGLYLDLSMDDLTPSLDNLVMKDADMGIVPLVQVRYEVDSDVVSISHVSVSRPHSKAGGERWRFREYTTGLIDKQTESFVRKKLPSGGTGGILAIPERRPGEFKIRFKRRGVYSLSQGDILCMSGGSITQTRTKNDYLLPLSLGGVGMPALICEDGEKLNLAIKRRDFSLNESTLRVQYSADPDAFKFNLLVSVIKHDDGSIGASLINLPFRNSEEVARWVRRFGTQNVTVSRPPKRGNGSVRVEIKPGVLCRAHETNSDDVNAVGTYLGRLSLGEGQQLCVEPLSESDSDFLVEGRIVEMLVKDSGKEFTFAGFPQVSLRDANAITAKKDTLAPRWVELGPKLPNGMPSIGTTDPKPIFGYLRAIYDEPAGRKTIVLFRNNDERYGREPWRRVKYHTLSYLEGSFDDLWNSIRNSRWHYHDQTYLLPSGQRRKYGENNRLPLLFADGMSLRCDESELTSHAFPPHEIEEYGMPGGVDEAWLPVAGGNDVSVYVELSPGRIIRIPSKRLGAGVQSSASSPYSGFFSPGDSILLAVRKAEPGQAAMMQIKAVSYGMRGWADGRMVLPFRSTESGQGLLVFGDGAFTVHLPSFLRFNHMVAAINRDTNEMTWNNLSLQVGDTVLIHTKEKGVRIAGFESVTVKTITLANTSLDQKWLETIVKRPEALSILIELLGGAIPACITSVDGNSASLELRQPPAPPYGSVLPLSPIGGDGNKHLLLRCGSRLFLADMSLVLAVSPELATEIVATMTHMGETLWFRWILPDGKGCGVLKSGTSDVADTKRSIKVLSAVDSVHGSGFLCIDISNGELLWMPLSETGITMMARARDVLEILKERGVLNVVMQGSFASYLRANVLFRRELNDMVVSGRAKATRVFLFSRLKSSSRERKYVYLCYEMPRGNIYELVSETDLGISLAVDAYFRGDGGAQSGFFVPCDQWRTPISLSCRSLSFIDKAYKARTDFQLRAIERKDFQQQYSAIERTVKESWANGAYDHTDAEANLIGLVSGIRKLRGEGYSEYDPNLLGALDAASDILRAYAKHAKSGGTSKQSVTVISVLCAILILNELGYVDDAVTLFDAIKKCLWNLEVEEYLLTRWLLDQEPISIYDLRRLLATLPLSGCEIGEKHKRLSTMTGTLTEYQRMKLVEICQLVLRRRHGLAEDLHSCLSLCLLSAAGQIKPKQKDILAKALEMVSIHKLELVGSVDDLTDGIILDHLVDSCPGLSLDDACSDGLISELFGCPSISKLLADSQLGSSSDA